MGVSKNSGFCPQIIRFNRVFHYFHHPFWGVSVFPYFRKHPNGGLFFSHGFFTGEDLDEHQFFEKTQKFRLFTAILWDVWMFCPFESV